MHQGKYLEDGAFEGTPRADWCIDRLRVYVESNIIRVALSMWNRYHCYQEIRVFHRFEDRCVKRKTEAAAARSACKTVTGFVHIYQLQIGSPSDGVPHRHVLLSLHKGEFSGTANTCFLICCFAPQKHRPQSYKQRLLLGQKALKREAIRGAEGALQVLTP